MENNTQNGYINGNAAVGSAAPAAAPAAPANAVQIPVTDNTAQFAAPAAKEYEKPQNTVPYAVIERPAPEKGASGLGFNIVSMWAIFCFSFDESFDVGMFVISPTVSSMSFSVIVTVFLFDILSLL